MTNRRSFLTQFTTGVGAMVMTPGGATSLVSKEEVEKLKMIGGEAEWQMLSNLNGNNEDAIKSLDFSIQYKSNGKFFIKTTSKKSVGFDVDNRPYPLENKFIWIVEKGNIGNCFLLFRIKIYIDKYNCSSICFSDELTKSTVCYAGRDLSMACINYLFEVRPDMVEEVNKFIGE